MKIIRDPRYPQYEIVPHLSGFSPPRKRYYVRYRNGFQISGSELTLRQARRFIVEHAAQEDSQSTGTSIQSEEAQDLDDWNRSPAISEGPTKSVPAGTLFSSSRRPTKKSRCPRSSQAVSYRSRVSTSRFPFYRPQHNSLNSNYRDCWVRWPSLGTRFSQQPVNLQAAWRDLKTIDSTRVDCLHLKNISVRP